MDLKSIDFRVLAHLAVLFISERWINFIFDEISCFGCFHTIPKNIIGNEFKCANCGLVNKISQNKCYPAEHSCINPDYCQICVSNMKSLVGFIANRKPRNFSNNNVFCSECIHNQKIVVTLLSENEHDDSANYRRKILTRHPLACPGCEEKVNAKIAAVNAKFKRDVLYDRLLASRSNADQPAKIKVNWDRIKAKVQNYTTIVAQIYCVLFQMGMLYFYIVNIASPNYTTDFLVKSIFILVFGYLIKFYISAAINSKLICSVTFQAIYSIYFANQEFSNILISLLMTLWILKDIYQFDVLLEFDLFKKEERPINYPADSLVSDLSLN